MAPVRLSSPPDSFISLCSAGATPRSPTLSAPHCSLHFAKSIRGKKKEIRRGSRRQPSPTSTTTHTPTPTPSIRLLLTAEVSDVADASSALHGVPDCSAIVQIQNQGSRCYRCFDSQRLFYAVLSFPSSTALFFFNM